ncbi:MAG: phytoene desaturase [Calditrichaceae bacterium]|nr:phytoene desaturase [Calditrichaceae bacterium]
MHNRVNIIGAGLGGLSAGIRLAKMGFDVSIYEKNEKTGGKMNELVYDSWRFDTGPSLLTMPFIVDDLFEFAGRKREDYLKFEKVDPVCRYFFAEGSRLDVHEETDRMVEELNRFNSLELSNYFHFLAYSKKLYDNAGTIFLRTPIHEWSQWIGSLTLSDIAKLTGIDALHTMHKSISRFFKDKRLIQLFDRYATYSGSNPYTSPATLNMIPYVETGLGAYYISGGMYRLTEALEKIALEFDVKIHTNTEVAKIIHKDKKVRAIVVNNELIETDYAVCNADVVTAYNDLIDSADALRRKYNKLEPSLSGLVFFWGVNKKHSELKHHNIFFSADYKKEFNELFMDKKPASDPTVYIAITSKTDGSHAPEYGENWFVLINMPYLKGHEKWTEIIDQTRESIFKRLKTSGIDIRRNIEFEKVHTPLTFSELYASNRGSIYGISSNSRFTTFLRPANRSRDIKGLYFAGGSAHPGGGIPLVIQSGRFAAELINRDHQKIKSGANTILQNKQRKAAVYA